MSAGVLSAEAPVADVDGCAPVRLASSVPHEALTSANGMHNATHRRREPRPSCRVACGLKSGAAIQVKPNSREHGSESAVRRGCSATLIVCPFRRRKGSGHADLSGDYVTVIERLHPRAHQGTNALPWVGTWSMMPCPGRPGTPSASKTPVPGLEIGRSVLRHSNACSISVGPLALAGHSVRGRGGDSSKRPARCSRGFRDPQADVGGELLDDRGNDAVQ